MHLCLLEEVLVVSLFYNRERRNDLRGYHVREQLARKASLGTLASRSSSMAPRAVASRKSLPPLVNAGQGYRSIGQVDMDRRRRRLAQRSF